MRMKYSPYVESICLSACLFSYFQVEIDISLLVGIIVVESDNMALFHVPCVRH